jgi:hypothetical protein
LTIFETDDMTDNTLVNVFPLKDELYTTTEIKYLNKIDPETLDKTEKVTDKNNIYNKVTRPNQTYF